MEKLFKRCPRCNRKMNAKAKKCDTCGLVFDRLNHVSNRAGKESLSRGERSQVIYVTTPPKDVNKWKLLLLDIFFGLIGVHYFKVGRNRLGILLAVSLFLFVASSALTYFGIIPESVQNDRFIGILLYFLLIPEAFSMIIWFSSIFLIIFNGFKYPVSIDKEYVMESLSSPVAEEVIRTAKGKGGGEKDGK